MKDAGPKPGEHPSGERVFKRVRALVQLLSSGQKRTKTKYVQRQRPGRWDEIKLYAMGYTQVRFAAWPQKLSPLLISQHRSTCMGAARNTTTSRMELLLLAWAEIVLCPAHVPYKCATRMPYGAYACAAHMCHTRICLGVLACLHTEQSRAGAA